MELEEPKMPTFAPGTSPAEMILNAWSKGAALKGAQQKLELALQQSNMNNMFREQNYERQMAQMNLNATNQTVAHNLELQRMGQDSYFKTRGLQDSEFKTWWLQNENATKDREVSGMLGETSALDINSPTYHQDLLKIMTKYPSAAATTTGNTLYKAKATDYNNNAVKQWDLYNTQVGSLTKEVNEQLWGYNRNDLGPIMEPKNWQDQTDPKTGKPTGKKFYAEPNLDPLTNRTKPTNYYTTDASKLQQWSNTIDQLNAAKAKLPTQINDPRAGVFAYPPGSTIQTPNNVQLAIKALQPNSGATPAHQAAARKILHDSGVQGY